MKLTELENKALEAMKKNQQDESGGSFGVIESIVWEDRKQLGGLITNLVKKGKVIIYGKITVNTSDSVTQFEVIEN